MTMEFSFNIHDPCNKEFIYSAKIRTLEIPTAALKEKLYFKDVDSNSWLVFLDPDLQDYLTKTTKQTIYCICSFQKHDMGNRVVIRKYRNKIKGVQK